jgi:hypothetical protein
VSGCSKDGPEKETPNLLDDLICQREQFRRHGQAKRFGGLQIDDKIKLGRLFDWDVARFRAPQNLVHHFGGAPPQGREVWSVGHQASSFDVFPVGAGDREAAARKLILKLR